MKDQIVVKDDGALMIASCAILCAPSAPQSQTERADRDVRFRIVVLRHLEGVARKVLHLPELREAEALEVDDDERAVDMFARSTSGRGKDFARERLSVDEDSLPETRRRDVLVQLRHVDTAEAMDIQRPTFFISLKQVNG